MPCGRLLSVGQEGELHLESLQNMFIMIHKIETECSTSTRGIHMTEQPMDISTSKQILVDLKGRMLALKEHL